MTRFLAVSVALLGATAAMPKRVELALDNEPVLGDIRYPGIDGNRLLEQRSSCDPQPAGFAPPTSPDTVDAFLANTDYAAISKNASLPQGYTMVFQNLQGAISQDGYLGFYTLTSYNTTDCQQKCDAVEQCLAFNIFIERDPSLEPGSGCEKPPSTENYICSLWGLPISNNTATNTVQYRADFEVAITASNGYVKPAAPPGYDNFTGPYPLPGAINAPSGYEGSTSFTGPFDPSQCAAACQATTQYDRAHADANGTYAACNYFVAYVLSENGAASGTTCAFYDQAWNASYATNVGQVDGQGNHYTISDAVGYTLCPQDPGVVSS